MRIFINLIIGVLILTACDGNWNTEIYTQKIPNSSKVIYDFSAWGGRDTHISGISIVDSTIEFDFLNTEMFPISIIEYMPNKDTLNIISLIKNKEEYSVTTYIENVDSLKVRIREYHEYPYHHKKSGVIGKYKFRKFVETQDSIKFIGLKKDYGATIDTAEISFLKGNIKLIEDTCKVVHNIWINKIEFIGNKDNKYACIGTYYFIPTQTYHTWDFSDNGIFKQKY